MDDNKQNIIEALNYIEPSELSYDDWLRVGMGIHAENLPMSVFDEWSKRDPNRYNEKDIISTWNSFGKGGGKEVTGGTIIQLAKDRGFDAHRKLTIGVYDWDDTLLPEEDLELKRPHRLSPTEQLIAYLKAVFKPTDKVGYVSNDCFYNADKDKWEPKRGDYDRTAEELIKALEKYPDDIECVIGTYQKEAGAWIRFNPLDGKGVSASNVTAYNYVLVESDTMPKKDQIAFYNRWQLPISALVDSGSKSVHAIVHIDAENDMIYQQRVLQLFNFLDEKGFVIDASNKNPNKLSRMPGVFRNGVMQELIAVNIGCANYQEWEKFVAEELATFEVMNVTDFFHNPEPQKAELIHGLLRKGHVLLVTGPSKAGKSFLMIRLAICISEGKPFLNFDCEKAKVVYINPEIEAASIGHRFMDVYDALKITEPTKDNPIQAINLRGTIVNIQELVEKLIIKYKSKGVDVFIIDPLYKFMDQDESDAQYMNSFLQRLEYLGKELNATIIFSHHHAKGPSAAKAVIDRGSGSGIMGRQADAIMDLTELQIDDEFREDHCFDDSWTAYQIEYVTREFKRPKTIKAVFKYPLHEIDTTNELKELYPVGDIRNVQKKNPKQATIEDRYNRFIDAFIETSKDGGLTAKLEDVAKKLKLSLSTIRSNVREIGGYKVVEGVIHKQPGGSGHGTD